MAARDARQLSDHERELFSRNIRVPEIGEEGQLALLRSRVLVVGAGGLGSPALLYLAAAGIGEIGIADGDRVEVSNLQRQVLHRARDVGRLKTESAREALLEVRPDLDVEVFPFRIEQGNAPGVLSGFDFIIDATDSFRSKLILNDACVQTCRPFSHAGIRGFYGQAMTVLPGESPCLRCVFPEAPENGEGGGEGVLACVAGILGSIQAAEAVKYLLGTGDLLTGKILTFDGAAMRFRVVDLQPEKRCEVCRAA
ncbi:MAG: HesA/MoeB/ThiF family protein [Proteobacteria bacterium]|nr:HesA/MoeB/ThiF family protein [Pseudomonadota bacterium]